MAELSPAVQAVLKAAQDSYWCFDAMAPANAEVIAAAVLRAAADQLTPETAEPNRSINTPPEQDVVFIGAWHIWNNQRKIRRELLALAAQLKTANV